MSMKPASFIVGIDIGGTFTDVLCIDPSSGAVTAVKVATTWPDPTDGLLLGVKSAVKDLRNVSSVIHGTTIATNAVLERKGAKVALITTRGFRDVLEMRRRQRPQTYGLKGNFEPLVPRYLRLEVTERMGANGTIVQPLDEAEFRQVLGSALEQNIEAVAVCFINGFTNAVHEERAREIIREMWPAGFVSMASQVLPEIKEFERTSTTVLNAVVQPVIDRYLGNVERQLALSGYPGQVSIVQSNGGVASVAATRDKPVTTMLSGPAAGVTGANAIARQAGIADIVTFDMGGTSLDASVVIGNRPCLTSEAPIDFGIIVKVPMIEIKTIGAGGGSIAKVTSGGFLQVGPQSAGSNPGPVAYGKGGRYATVTDANIVLGRINAERPIGAAAQRFGIAAAQAAIHEQIARPLGLSIHSAAEAIVRVANTRMAGAARLVTIQKGFDPRRFTLVAYGGGGPLHVAGVMREVGIQRALVPLYPGLTSALGCAIGNLQYDLVQTIGCRVDAAGLARAHTVWGQQCAAGLELLDSGLRQDLVVETHYAADMQHVGQTHTLLVSLGELPATVEAFEQVFRQCYRETYGLCLELPVSIINVRTSVVGVRKEVALARMGTEDDLGDGTLANASRGSRQVWIGGKFRDVPVYERLLLPRGTKLAGPVIVEQDDSTVLIECDMKAETDAHRNLILEG